MVRVHGKKTMSKNNKNKVGIGYKLLYGIVSMSLTVGIGYLIIRAGNIDSPGVPDSAGRMYTLENIYDYLTTGTAPSKATGAFANPTAGPGSTMHTTDEIFAAITDVYAGCASMPATGQTTSYGTKQREDGYYESGAILSYSTTDVSGEIIVNDLNTGLMWEQKTAGNKTTTYTWENAQTYCEDQIGTTGTYAGYSDWRLPNVKELYGITKLDANQSDPYIDQTYFPNTQSFYYRSSTTDPNLTDFALIVRFNYGDVSNSYKTNSRYVRCVRGQ